MHFCTRTGVQFFYPEGHIETNAGIHVRYQPFSMRIPKGCCKRTRQTTPSSIARPPITMPELETHMANFLSRRVLVACPPPDGICVPGWVCEDPQRGVVTSEIVTVGLGPLADRRMCRNRRQAGKECICRLRHLFDPSPWDRRRGPGSSAQRS
jgi:hypothetical protein